MSVDVIAKACRRRRKTHSRSRLHRQSDHYRDWLTSLGVKVYPEPDWSPPEYRFYYKIAPSQAIPKINAKVNLNTTPSQHFRNWSLKAINDTIELALVPSIFAPRTGRTSYAANPEGHIKLTVRLNSIRKVCALDGEIWHDTIAVVTHFQEQDLVLPTVYQGCLKYVPDLGDYLRFIYSPGQRSSAFISYSRGVLGTVVPQFFPPYLHFDTCIECQDRAHQIGYIVTNGPRFATIDRLQQNPIANVGQSFNYMIDKVVCAKTGNELVTVTKQSFRLKIEILSIQAEKDIVPDYCMVVGRIRECSHPILYPNEAELLARNENESDANLFLPGTYIYIDHYVNQRHSQSSTNPYSDNSESAQLCYIIGPKTPEFGACPIRPFS